MVTFLTKGKQQAIDQALSRSRIENKSFKGQPAVQFLSKEQNPPLTEVENLVLASGPVS